MAHHGNDSDTQVFFYENEFYCLSNFSSFSIEEDGILYITSEYLYHTKKFNDPEIKMQIIQARSTHDAQKIANQNKDKMREDWHDIKVDVMRDILRLKIDQHPYVKKKLLDTGDREIIENSWRDTFWGWGENKDGQNMLGKLWMELRGEIK